MIKNEKQYWITRKKLQELYDEINLIERDEKTDPTDELTLVSLLVLKEQMEAEIGTYDQSKAEPLLLLQERSIDELPELLIEFKIQLGLTQKQFSQKIGMKEQQLQRYEAENYNSISFKNLLNILHAAGLEVTVRGTVSGANPSSARFPVH